MPEEIKMPKPYLEQLPDEIKKDTAKVEALSKFNSWGEVVSTYFETDKARKDLEGTVNTYKTKTYVPGEGATPEEVSAYKKAIGAGEKPEEYEVELNDPAQKEFFAKSAAELGLTKSQAKEFSKKYSEFLSKNAPNPDQEAAVVTEALKKEWGSDFEANKANISATFLKFVSADEAPKLLEKYGNDVVINRIFAKIGSELRSLKIIGDSSTRETKKREGFYYPSLEEK